MLKKNKNVEDLYATIPEKYQEDFNKLETRFKNRVCMFWVCSRKSFEENNYRQLRLEIQACLYAQHAIKLIHSAFPVDEKTIVNLSNLDGEFKHEEGTPTAFAIAVAMNSLIGKNPGFLFLPAVGDLDGKILYPHWPNTNRFCEEYGLDGNGEKI